MNRSSAALASSVKKTCPLRSLKLRRASSASFSILSRKATCSSTKRRESVTIRLRALMFSDRYTWATVFAIRSARSGASALAVTLMIVVSFSRAVLTCPCKA